MFMYRSLISTVPEKRLHTDMTPTISEVLVAVVALALNAPGLCSPTTDNLSFAFDKGDCTIVIYDGGETDAIKVRWFV